MNFTGKTILVTGATSGIGRATTDCLIAAGAHVVAIGRNTERLAAMHVQFGAVCTGIAFDLAQTDGFAGLVAGLPAFDGVVMSAGIAKKNFVKFFNKEVFEETLSINLTSPIYLAVELVNQKKLKAGGSLVFLSSISGTSAGVQGALAYATTKAGITGAAKSLAAELSPKNIRVNCVAPAMVATEMATALFSRLTPEALQQDIQKYPLGKRYAKPSEVADLIAFLLSDRSTYITGQVMTIDGGYGL